MQNLDPFVEKLSLQGFDDIPLLQAVAQKIPNARPSHFALIGLAVCLFLCFIGVGGHFIVNMVGLIVPAYLAIEGIEKGNVDVEFLLHYFLIFSFMIVFSGTIQFLLGFLPFFYLIKLILVVALFHPQVQLAKSIWSLVEKFL